MDKWLVIYTRRCPRSIHTYLTYIQTISVIRPRRHLLHNLVKSKKVMLWSLQIKSVLCIILGWIFWDDENDELIDAESLYQGYIPAGIYEKDTLIYTCCRTDGDKMVRHSSSIIPFPNRKTKAIILLTRIALLPFQSCNRKDHRPKNHSR